MNRIRVVSALIMNDAGEMLMALRPHGALRPAMWEHPGGKVNPGEGDHEALRRELREEIGVEARVIRLVSDALLEVEIDLDISLFEVTIDGDPRPLCSDGIQWVAPTWAIMHMPCTPATYHFHVDVLRAVAHHEIARLRDEGVIPPSAVMPAPITPEPKPRRSRA